MKWGVHPRVKRFEFWKSLNLPGEWIQGEIDELIAAKVNGIFVNPDDSDEFYRRSRQIVRQVEESRFIDFIELNAKGLRPLSQARQFGAELLVRGSRSLDTGLRAYVTGNGPWARLFALIAIEKGFSDVRLVVKELEEAQILIDDFKKFCFGVNFEAIRHADLTLQANNGALLVNTIDPHSDPELAADLAYLNYLSPSALVIETHESSEANPLVEEARHSRLALLDGATVQGFVEFNALKIAGISIPFDEYLEKRAGNSPSVQ